MFFYMLPATPSFAPPRSRFGEDLGECRQTSERTIAKLQISHSRQMRGNAVMRPRGKQTAGLLRKPGFPFSEEPTFRSKWNRRNGLRVGPVRLRSPIQ